MRSESIKFSLVTIAGVSTFFVGGPVIAQQSSGADPMTEFVAEALPSDLMTEINRGTLPGPDPAQTSTDDTGLIQPRAVVDTRKLWPVGAKIKTPVGSVKNSTCVG